MNYLLEFIQSGQRMSQPPNCPTELLVIIILQLLVIVTCTRNLNNSAYRYILMRDCWMDNPTGRPIFSHLVEDIGRILYIACETVSIH